MMRIVELETGTVFKKTHKSLNKGNNIIIHKGGTGSGKTYDLMMYLIFIALQKKNQIITVVSESRPHLEIGTVRYLKEITKDIGLINKDTWNASKLILTYKPTKSIIEFFSADRIEKALGARRHWLYGNEIDSLKFNVWDELAGRSKYEIGRAHV